MHKPVPEDSGGPSPRCATCWVCQCPAFEDKCANIAGRILPVCINCWDTIPAAERIKIGLAMMSDDDMRPLKQIAAVVLSHIDGDSARALNGGLFGKQN